MNERRTLLQVLEDVPSCQPQIGHLLELIPRLQVRYYSIASSPRVRKKFHKQLVQLLLLFVNLDEIATFVDDVDIIA